ncbi:hypothetical protein [Sphingomonas arenae]|uniref:hypothetical protein n=1 Tax=Sphingomonas arenae TaxID=2812555 RepID=UPI0019671860|nr:hypothetical protein [Sphingomonas arenae]
MLFSSLTFLPTVLALLGIDQPRLGITRVVVQEQVTIRVPVVRARPTIPVRWVEKKGPRCIASDAVLAATLAEGRSIDFHLRDRRRIRAKMDGDCPALDFYRGFYLQPDDDRICAGRDEIRSRIGGSCQIERFRLMVPRRPK